MPDAAVGEATDESERTESFMRCKRETVIARCCRRVGIEHDPCAVNHELDGVSGSAIRTRSLGIGPSESMYSKTDHHDTGLESRRTPR